MHNQLLQIKPSEDKSPYCSGFWWLLFHQSLNICWFKTSQQSAVPFYFIGLPCTDEVFNCDTLGNYNLVDVGLP